jgi:hypothetical protein
VTRLGLWRVNLALLVVSVALVAVPAFVMQRAIDDQCSHLMAIAADSRKTQYLRAWAAERAKDEQFLAQVRQYPWFEHGDPTSWHFVDLDWGYLGLSQQLARVEFNDGNGSYIRTVGIRSVSLYQGRSGIIVGLSSGDLGLGTWRAEEVRKLRRVADDVFVYCDDSP